MKQRKLGAAGPLVGEIGLGAMSFGGIFGGTNADESHRTLDKALDLGVTHIDTALIYGPHVSEEVIGTYLRKNPAARKQFVIATKGGIQPNPRCVINSGKFLRECLDGSLQRLGVDAIDLYYIHRREQAIPIEEVTGTLQSFIEQGKIKAFGFSEISPASLERASAIHPVAAVQNEYSLWTRLPELGLIDACKRLGTTLVAFSPLARGALADTSFNPASLPPNDWRRAIPRMSDVNWPSNAKRIEGFRHFAQSRGWTTEALALAWVLSRAPHIIPIPGTRSPEHLARDAAASGVTLTPEDLAEIERLLPAGFAHGARYSDEQQRSAEQYC